MRRFFKSLTFVIAILPLLEFSAIGAESTQQAATDDVKALFEEKYRAWQEYCKQPEIGLSSNSTPYIDNDPYREIIQLGIPVLPYMIQKIENDRAGGGVFLGYAVSKITKKKFHIKRTGQKPSEFRWTVEEFPDIRQSGGPPDSRDLWLRWWREGIKETPQRLEKLYSEWKTLKESAQEERAKETYQKIIDLGIVALPCIVRKVEEGDTALIPAISKLTDGAIDKEANASECVKWWEKNKEKWTIPPQIHPVTYLFGESRGQGHITIPHTALQPLAPMTTQPRR